MNKGHDVGGKPGFSVIPFSHDLNEPVFRATWEARVFALTTAVEYLDKWNLDQARDAIEKQSPDQYFEHSYYENWLFGLEKLLIETGLVTTEELETGVADVKSDSREAAPLRVEQVESYIHHHYPNPIGNRPVARFKAGDSVTAMNITSRGHTRLPGYVQGKRGVIRHQQGVHALPDQNALGTIFSEHLYNVCFSANEICGSREDPKFSVNVDLWESYLKPA